MSKETQRPTEIKIKKGSNITIKDNTGYGDMNLIDAEDVHNLDADRNKLITPESQAPNANKRWHERPVGMVTLMVLAGLLVAYGTYYFGW